MRVTKHIYKRMQEEFPDLFVETIKSKATSTVYAEFLPNAALADPNGSPWGQYGNREIPPKRKTIVISFNAIAALPFSEIKKIDEAARFLKRAGFNVLIPVGNELQNYERQLFDRENITLVGNKTRAEMQRMALSRNVPADEVFFIDDVKKEVDEKFIETLCNKFELIEKDIPLLPVDIYDSTEHRVKFIPQNVGRLAIQTYSSDQPWESDLETIKKDLEKALSKYRLLNLDLDDVLMLHEHEHGHERYERMMDNMMDKYRTHNEKPHEPELKFLTDYELLLLTITDSVKNLDDLDAIGRDGIDKSHASDVLRLIRAGIPFKAIASIDDKFLLGVVCHVDSILKPGIDYNDVASLTESNLRPIIDDDYHLANYVMPLVESLKKHQLTNIDSQADARKDKKDSSYPNLYYLSIRAKLSQELRKLLVDHAQFLEELNVQTFEYFSEILRENKSFQNLISLTCSVVTGVFDIIAPKLTYLKISTLTDLEISTEQKSAHIYLKGIPHLSRLAIDCGLFFDIESERRYPVITSAKNKNLTELHITGNIRSLDFLETLLVNSPNLKLLELCQISVPEKDLQKLGRRFPNLQIKVVSYRVYDSYFRKPQQAASISSPSLQGRPGMDAGDPNAVYQSTHKSVQHSQYAVGSGGVAKISGESPEIGLRNCLLEAFAWGGVDSVRDPLGRLKVISVEQSARQTLGNNWKHEFLYEKYQQLLELQAALDSAVDKIKIDELDSSACDDLFIALNNVKKFLEDKNEDYKTEFFNKTKKTTTKKDFYRRITNSIGKVESYKKYLILQKVLDPLPSPKSPASPQVDKREEDVVYTNSATNELTSDFDTQHDPEKKFTMEEACTHVSKNKKNRFPYTRHGIYTLDLDKETLFSSIESHVSSTYEIPAYQATLSIDDSHDFYKFSEKIDLHSGNRYRISGLSSRDILLQLTLNGKPLTNSNIEIQKDEFGFYTLKALVTLKGDLGYFLDVPAEQVGLWGRIPQELQTMITNIQSFPSKAVDVFRVPPHAIAAQKLDAMYEQRKGACRHRVAIFLHKLNELKAAHPQLYTHIEARGVDRGGVHANIEISIDGGKTFEMLELGGYEAKKQYVSTKLPALQFSSKQKKDAPKPVFTDILDQIDRSRGKNTLLCLSQSSDIYTCLSHIRQKSSARPIFYVDSEDSLRISLKRLKLNPDRTRCEINNPPAGLLHDFLIQHQNSDPPPIIVINWENFKPSDMVQFNSVIDVVNRRVDNTPIPAGATIVGLHSRSEKMIDLLGDSSFVSRHATGGIFDLTTTSLPLISQAQVTASAAVSGVLKINLHKSSRWQELLIGKAFVDGDQLRWQDGELAQLIPPSSISHVEFVNPPVNDRAFNNFIADLRAGLPLTFLNQVLSIGRTVDVKISDKPEFANGVRLEVTHSDLLTRDAFVINSSTFEQCLHGKKITDDGLLVTEKGLIEAHANGILKLCLCDNLSGSQWSLLLDYAKKFNVTLDLMVTKNVTTPTSVTFTENAAAAILSETRSPNQFIVSDDVEYSVLKLQQELSMLSSTRAIVVDLSEVTLDDLFCKIEHKITDAGFSFNRRMSAVWQALSRGETVILKGNCSQEMLNYLATIFSPTPYFYMECQKHFFSGKLIVVADDAIKIPSWLSVENQKISIAEKRVLLHLPADEFCENKPFIQLAMENKKKLVPSIVIAQSDVLPATIATVPQSKMLDGLRIDGNQLFNRNGIVLGTFRLSEGGGQITLSFSGTDGCAFNDAQRKQLLAFLDMHGFGDRLKSNRAVSLNVTFAPKGDVQEATSPHDLSLSFCENFERNRLLAVKHVLSYSPFVLLEGAPGVGKSYFMRSLQSDPSIKFYREDEVEKWATEVVPPGVQKILFRDEINLRGIDCSQDRDLLNNPPSIFVNGKYFRLTENCKIMYAQNPLDYGGERHEPKLFQDLPDCKVVFEQMSPSFVLHRILKPIYETTFDPTESERRAEKIIQDHFSSMRSIRDLQTKAIFECALHRNPIPPTPHAATKEVCLGLNDFVLTTSRFEPYRDVLTLLQARSFKRALLGIAPDGARFNGANGLVLQGPPGVGKSEFIESVLKSEGYNEITHDTLQSDIESEKVYYRLRASVSNEEKLSILHKAFQQGAILIIDEIDSCPLLEDYLNAYLVGEDIHGKRASSPGFTILSTANGAEMKGRRVLPAPLKSRMLALEFNEYSREDLVAILDAKFISPGDSVRQLKLDMIAFLVDGFLTEQNTNKETPPTFRDLYVVAKDYFENNFERYADLELSKQQHEFMLVYRNHPKLSQLIRRLESQELKAIDMTLDALDKSLKSDHESTLFGRRESGTPDDPQRADFDKKSFFKSN